MNKDALREQIARIQRLENQLYGAIYELEYQGLGIDRRIADQVANSYTRSILEYVNQVADVHLTEG